MSFSIFLRGNNIWLGLKTPDGKRLFKKNKNNYEGPLKKDPQYAKYRPFSIQNLIFKTVRQSEHGHFVDILGIKHQIHGKVIFVLLNFFLFFSLHIKNYAGREKEKKIKD